MRQTRFLYAFVIALTIAFALQVNRVELPPPFETPSVNNGPRVIPRPPQAELKLPPGFHVEVFAEGFERPRFMLLGPSNEILLADSADSGSVYVLDGKERRKILEG